MDKRKAVWLLAASGAMTVAAMAGLIPVLSDWRILSKDPATQDACISSHSPPQAETRSAYPDFRALVHQTQTTVVEVSAARAAQMNTPLQGGHSWTQCYENVSVGFLAASVAGLQERVGWLPGNVLLAINGISVNSIAQALQVMLKHPRAIEVLGQRKGERLLVPLELS